MAACPSLPDWVPDFVPLDDYGDPAVYIDALYEMYLEDIINGNLTFDGRPVRCKRIPYERGKDATFWHITQEGEVEADRTMDLRRSERIRWIKAIIEHAGDPAIKRWTEKRGSDARVHLWLEAGDFLVVLADRKTYVLLWTAFHVGYGHYGRNLEKRYQRHRKS